jgi:hypothetical protein
MSTVSKESYKRLLENRPYKFDSKEVDYREHTGKEKCEGCSHFYTRQLDGFTVCEIYRTADDSPVDVDGVCDFFTVDGKEFPLLD